MTGHDWYRMTPHKRSTPEVYGRTDNEAAHATIEYLPERGIYRTACDSKMVDEPSVTVVTTVASLDGVDPSELDPLYDHVDSDALDALLCPESQRTPGSVEVTFRFNGYSIRVDDRGTIEVEP